MSYATITPEEIQVGEPTAKPLFDKIKGDLDDHESRLGATEVAATTRPPIEFGVFGVLQSPLTYDGILITRIDINLTITAVRLLVKLAGSSGTVSVDVEYKRGVGAWTSILTGNVSVAQAAGDYAIASGVLAVTDLEAGDLIRLNVDSVQVDMEDFSVFLENEVA